MRITNLGEEHLESYFVCLEDWSDEMKEAGDHKASWYQYMKDKGLGVKLALDKDRNAVGMIQYLPVEHSYADAGSSRKGIEIRGRKGQPVVAAEAGKVVYAGAGLIGYGRLIIVKHNKNYLSAYGHNRKLLVQEGERVTKGQPVAEMGSDSTGEPVLHFQIRRDGKPVDPLKLLPRYRL